MRNISESPYLPGTILNFSSFFSFFVHSLILIYTILGELGEGDEAYGNRTLPKCMRVCKITFRASKNKLVFLMSVQKIVLLKMLKMDQQFLWKYTFREYITKLSSLDHMAWGYIPLKPWREWKFYNATYNHRVLYPPSIFWWQTSHIFSGWE